MKNIFCMKTFACLLLSLIVFSNLACASALHRMERIMHINEVSKVGIGRDAKGENFTLNGQELMLKPYFNAVNRYVKLISQDGKEDYMSFLLEKPANFRAYKIFAAHQKEFILILGSKPSSTDSVCTGAWVIGNHEGKLICFIDLDDLRNAGLVFREIAPSIVDGELLLEGFARESDCRVYSPDMRDVVDYRYQGHPAYPSCPGICNITSVSLFWDDKAQWFGIRN